MAQRKAIYLFFLLFVVDVCVIGVESRWMINEEEDSEFDKQLKILNKPAVKTFESQSGHFYDCIDIYKQPAFDNPLLQNHKLQMRPSSFPEGITSEQQLNITDSNLPRNRKCPSGTVIIRRTTKNDLIYAKYHHKSFRRHITSIQPQSTANDGSHYAVMKSYFGEYYGSRAKIIVYGFPNIPLDQSTISQIWVVGGADGPEDRVNTVQAGWSVYPSANDGDSLTHLYTYWTPDGYKSGCFNLVCQGFMVLSPDFGPGSEITQLSTYGGIQESIELVIFKDQKTGNWWLAYGKEKSLVGYWPKDLFNNLDKATEIDWGGAVYSPFSKPSPPMGSGHLPNEGPNRTCYITNVQLINDKNQLYDPDDNKVRLTSDIPDYYDVDNRYASGDPDGYQFRFGGPGGYTKKR